jgi:AcrR family transcriptional regulator
VSTTVSDPQDTGAAGWQRRVVDRSLDDAKRRSIDRGARLIRAAAKVLDRNNGESLTVQEVADEAGQSLRTLYQYFGSKDDLLLAVFEEAMRVYAQLLEAAIATFDDPLERLAAAMIAAGRLPEVHGSGGRDRGLSQLRLHLSGAQPNSLASAQQPVISLFRALIADAVDAGQLAGVDVEKSTYFVCSLRNAYSTSTMLGNDLGLRLPDVIEVSLFCLSGLGAAQPRAWHERIDGALRLSKGEGRFILRKLAQDPAGRKARRSR